MLVCGDRDWKDGGMVSTVLSGLLIEARANLDQLTIIEGCASGADTFAHDYPTSTNCAHVHFPAHWRHSEDCLPGCKRVVGKAAGVLRNQQMLDVAWPDLVVAFHDDLPNSKGTKDMVGRAVRAGLPVWHLTHIVSGRLF